ncbi:hypothetical protein BTS2_3545 [Bacillus sp. TS-2]|nr:hypothetical protein BTS2_3545 [Bacillus sp. TS-2]
MKENPNRGILIAILVCLILILFSNSGPSSEQYDDFPIQMEMISDGQITALGENRFIVNSYGELHVFEWDEEESTYKWIETFHYYDRIN